MYTMEGWWVSERVCLARRVGTSIAKFYGGMNIGPAVCMGWQTLQFHYLTSIPDTRASGVPPWFYPPACPTQIAWNCIESWFRSECHCFFLPLLHSRSVGLIKMNDCINDSRRMRHQGIRVCKVARTRGRKDARMHGCRMQDMKSMQSWWKSRRAGDPTCDTCSFAAFRTKVAGSRASPLRECVHTQRNTLHPKFMASAYRYILVVPQKRTGI